MQKQEIIWEKKYLPVKTSHNILCNFAFQLCVLKKKKVWIFFMKSKITDLENEKQDNILYIYIYIYIYFFFFLFFFL